MLVQVSALQLHVDLQCVNVCKCVIQKWAIPLDFVARRLVLFLWAFTSGATESVLNKFGFIRFGKGEFFWMKTLK